MVRNYFIILTQPRSVMYEYVMIPDAGGEFTCFFFIIPDGPDQLFSHLGTLMRNYTGETCTKYNDKIMQR